MDATQSKLKEDLRSHDALIAKFHAQILDGRAELWRTREEFMNIIKATITEAYDLGFKDGCVNVTTQPVAAARFECNREMMRWEYISAL